MIMRDKSKKHFVPFLPKIFTSLCIEQKIAQQQLKEKEQSFGNKEHLSVATRLKKFSPRPRGKSVIGKIF